MGRELLSYYGGKTRMVSELVRYIVPHRLYVEGFGGMASLLFYKEPSIVEVYNDRDERVVRFFRALRERGDEVIRAVELTPYARDEFRLAIDGLDSEKDDVEFARKFTVYIWQCVNSRGSSYVSDWSYSKVMNRASGFMKLPEKLRRVVQRLKMVMIENLDIFELLDKYDSEETFWYLDPPYYGPERVAKKRYRVEMTGKEQERLVNRLLRIKGKVLLSGYKNNLYDKLVENGWNSVVLSVRKSASISSSKSMAREMIWFNYNLINYSEVQDG